MTEFITLYNFKMNRNIMWKKIHYEVKLDIPYSDIIYVITMAIIYYHLTLYVKQLCGFKVSTSVIEIYLIINPLWLKNNDLENIYTDIRTQNLSKLTLIKK